MRIISFFIFIAVALCGCTANTMPSPYTLQEVLDLHSLLPIYKLGPEINNNLSQENTKYFLFDDGPEMRLIIYFMMTNSKSEIVRAAKLSIYTANGQLITLEENGNKSYPVKWAQGVW